MAVATLSPTLKQVAIPLKMTAQTARGVIWQGKGPREPIGVLLDSRYLTYRDLAWAVDGAYRPEVREAARTLLSVWLGETRTVETASRFGPEVLGRDTWLREQEENRLIDMAAVVGVFVGALIGLGIYYILWVIGGGLDKWIRLGPVGQVIDIVASVTLLAWLISYVYRRVKRNLDEFRNFRDGREAEEEALEKLRHVLDSRWTIIRNLQLPGHKDNIDLTLVGPDGVWALEVKAYKNPLRLQGAQWEILNKKQWQPLRANPTKQATRNAARISSYLEQFGIKRWVHGVIVIKGPHEVRSFKTSDNPIWLMNGLEEQVPTLKTNIPPTQTEIGQIVTALKQLVKQTDTGC